MSETSGTDQGGRPPTGLTRYDLLLLAMPLAFMGTFHLADRVDLGLAAALAAAAVSSGLLGGVGVFASPPTGTDEP